jgi:hypothetical protein
MIIDMGNLKCCENLFTGGKSMQKVRTFSLVTVLLLVSTLATAAEKLVVVPLSSPNDSWIRVYDQNDVFVGFSSSFPMGGMPYTYVVSSNNFTSFLVQTVNDRLIFYDATTIIYLNSSCSGEKYIPQIPLLPEIGNGMMVDVITSASNATTSYYIRHDMPPVTIGPGVTYYKKSYSTPCTPTVNGASDIYVTEIIPNDPAVTGFEESATYVVPLQYQYRLPSRP